MRAPGDETKTDEELRAAYEARAAAKVVDGEDAVDRAIRIAKAAVAKAGFATPSFAVDAIAIRVEAAVKAGDLDALLRFRANAEIDHARAQRLAKAARKGFRGAAKRRGTYEKKAARLIARAAAANRVADFDRAIERVMDGAR